MGGLAAGGGGGGGFIEGGENIGALPYGLPVNVYDMPMLTAAAVNEVTSLSSNTLPAVTGAELAVSAQVVAGCVAVQVTAVSAFVAYGPVRIVAA